MRSAIANTSLVRKKVILKIYREKSNVSDTYLRNLLPNAASKDTSK